MALEVVKRTLSMPRRRAFEESRTVEALMHTITFAQPDVRAALEANYVE